MPCICVELLATKTEVNEMAGNKLLGIFVFASKLGIPLAILMEDLSTFLASASLVKIETGLFASEVLSTYPKPMVFLSIIISPVRLLIVFTIFPIAVGLLKISL